MERFITGGFTVEGRAAARRGFTEIQGATLRSADFTPALTAMSMDIETQGLEGALYSIAVAGQGGERVFMVGRGQSTDTLRIHRR